FAIRRSMPLRILTGPAVLGRLSFTLSSSIIASVKKSPSLCSCLGRLLRRADGTLGPGSGNENGAGKKLPATLETKPATLETKSELPHAIWPRGFALQVLLLRGISLCRRPHLTLFRSGGEWWGGRENLKGNHHCCARRQPHSRLSARPLRRLCRPPASSLA